MMYAGDVGLVCIPYGVILRKTEVGIHRIRYDLSFREHTAPSVEDMKPEEAVRHDRVKVKRYRQIFLPLYHDETNCSAIKTSPAKPLVYFVS